MRAHPGTGARGAIVAAVDLDDTLFPELDYARSALRTAGFEIARRFRIADVGVRAVRLLDREAPPALPLQQALRDTGITLSDAELSPILAVMHAHHPTISLFPETMGVLNGLRRRAMLVLVTEGRALTQRRKLDALKIEDLFDAVFVTEEMGPGVTKDSGVPYEAVRQRYPAATRFLMIGDDEEKDAVPAQRHGFDVTLVRRPDVRYVKPSPRRPTCPSLGHAVAALGVDPERAAGDQLASEKPC